MIGLLRGFNCRRNITSFLQFYKFDGLLFDFYHEWRDIKVNLVNEFRIATATDYTYFVPEVDDVNQISTHVTISRLNNEKKKLTLIPVYFRSFSEFGLFQLALFQLLLAQLSSPKSRSPCNNYTVDSIINDWIKKKSEQINQSGCSIIWY